MRTNVQGTSTLAGGCFWCLEAVYEQVQGVASVVSGYSGGDSHNPSYAQVCTGTTGHAEAVQITFDPEIVSYKDILYIFFTIHDPTTLNRQGGDIGTQYRSAIFYHSASQKTQAIEVISDISEQIASQGNIVTELIPFKHFAQAEDYHRQYYQRNLGTPYCQLVIDPKLAKLRKEHIGLLKPCG